MQRDVMDSVSCEDGRGQVTVERSAKSLPLTPAKRHISTPALMSVRSASSPTQVTSLDPSGVIATGPAVCSGATTRPFLKLCVRTVSGVRDIRRRNIRGPELRAVGSVHGRGNRESSRMPARRRRRGGDGRLGEIRGCLLLLSKSFNPTPSGAYHVLIAHRGSNGCEQTECPANSAASRLIVPHTPSSTYDTVACARLASCHFCRLQRENHSAECALPHQTRPLPTHQRRHPPRPPTSSANSILLSRAGPAQMARCPPRNSVHTPRRRRAHNIQPCPRNKNKPPNQAVHCLTLRTPPVFPVRGRQERCPQASQPNANCSSRVVDAASLLFVGRFECPSVLARPHPYICRSSAVHSETRLLTSILSTVCMHAYGARLNQETNNPEGRHYA